MTTFISVTRIVLVKLFVLILTVRIQIIFEVVTVSLKNCTQIVTRQYS